MYWMKFWKKLAFSAQAGFAGGKQGMKSQNAKAPEIGTETDIPSP